MTSTSTRRPDREPVGLRRSGAPGPLDRPPGPVARRMNTFVRTLAASWVADPRVAVSLAGAGVLLGMLLGATAPNAEAIGVRLPLSLLPSLSGQTVLASLMLYAAEILAGLGLAFVAGLLADVAFGALLGEQALRLVIMAFILQRFRTQLRFFPLPQQALAIGGLLFNDRVVAAALHLVLGLPQLPWAYWLAPLVGMALWMPLFLGFDAVRQVRRPR